MVVWEPGVYEHTCPSCGEVTRFIVSERLSMRDEHGYVAYRGGGHHAEVARVELDRYAEQSPMTMKFENAEPIGDVDTVLDLLDKRWGD